MENQLPDSSIDAIEQQFEPLYEQLKTTEDFSTDIITDTVQSTLFEQVEETKSMKDVFITIEETKSVENPKNQSTE